MQKPCTEGAIIPLVTTKDLTLSSTSWLLNTHTIFLTHWGAVKAHDSHTYNGRMRRRYEYQHDTPQTYPLYCSHRYSGPQWQAACDQCHLLPGVWKQRSSVNLPCATFNTTIAISHQSSLARTGQDTLISCPFAYRSQENEAKPPHAPELLGISFSLTAKILIWIPQPCGPKVQTLPTNPPWDHKLIINSTTS